MVQVPTLARLIPPDRIFPRLHASSRRQVLRDLVGVAAPQLGADHRAVFSALMSQPDLPTFGPSRGVAMPHACIDGLDAPAAFLARLARPIPFGAADGELVQIVALVLSPQDDPSTLLRSMSCVARRLRDRAVRDAILSAGDSDAIFSVLVSEDWREPLTVPAICAPSRAGRLGSG